ncbi:MAG: hypothetical protein SH850_13300 [Planctomycetaceae bacterium]|nr:hypothetical protein [Planctomycetaceae bacterium]
MTHRLLPTTRIERRLWEKSGQQVIADPPALAGSTFGIGAHQDIDHHERETALETRR